MQADKKGQSILFMIFEVLIVVLVVASVFQIANSFTQSETVTKARTATEIALLVNAMVGSPGDALVEYPSDLSSFILVLTSNKIQVYLEGETQVAKSKGTRFFYLPQGYTAVGASEFASRVCIEKRGKTLQLKECQ